MSKPESGRVNIGVIGLGDHSDRAHMMYLAQLDNLCTVRGLADLHQDRIDAANNTYGFAAAGFTDWQDLVRSDEIEAVFIMTPDRFHTAQLVGAVAAGKHVFCEKPLASSNDELGQVERALEVARQMDIVVSTCHPRRFDPPFTTTKHYLENPSQLMRDFQATGDLGKVTGFEFNFDYHKPSKQGLHHSLMFDHLNHEIDAMHFLFGVSDIAQADKHYDSETEFKVTGFREDGLAFTFVGARHRQERVYPEDMRIIFENGSLAMDLHAAHASLTVGDVTYVRHDDRFKTNYATRFMKMNEHFLRCVLGTEAPYISTKEMLINTRAAIELKDKPELSTYLRS